MFKKLGVSGLLSLFALEVYAQAASVVPAGTISTLTDDGTATLTAVGGAMIGLAAVAVLFKWGKAAIFG